MRQLRSQPARAVDRFDSPLSSAHLRRARAICPMQKESHTAAAARVAQFDAPSKTGQHQAVRQTAIQPNGKQKKLRWKWSRAKLVRESVKRALEPRLRRLVHKT